METWETWTIRSGGPNGLPNKTTRISTIHAPYPETTPYFYLISLRCRRSTTDHGVHRISLRNPSHRQHLDFKHTSPGRINRTIPCWRNTNETPQTLVFRYKSHVSIGPSRTRCQHCLIAVYNYDQLKVQRRSLMSRSERFIRSASVPIQYNTTNNSRPYYENVRLKVNPHG